MSRTYDYSSSGAGQRRPSGPGRVLAVGMVYGAIAWIVGYVLSWVLFRTDSSFEGGDAFEGGDSLEVGSGPSTWEEVGWVFHNSHLADLAVTSEFTGEDGSVTSSASVNLISDDEITYDVESGAAGASETVPVESASHPDLLFYLVPAVALLGAGFLAVRSLRAVSITGAAVGGGAVVAGYLPLTVAGTFLFGYSEDVFGGVASVRVEPALLSSVLLMGVAWAVVFGGLGGLVRHAS